MANEEVKHKYKVKPGFTHGARDQYGPGATVELTDAEAVGLSDKLELVKGHSKPVIDEDALISTVPLDLRSAIAKANDEELLEVPYVTKRNLPTIRAWATGTDTGLKDGEAVTGNTATVLADAVGPVTVEIVDAKPLKTVETVEIEESGDDLGNPPGQ